MDRLSWLTSRDERAAARPSGPTLAEALADREAAVVRIRARYDRAFRMYHDCVAWTAAFRRIDLDQAQQQALIAWHLDLYPDVDWTRDQQIIVATGEIQTAPDAWETGWDPEEDYTFGGSDPATAPRIPTEPGRAAA